MPTPNPFLQGIETPTITPPEKRKENEFLRGIDTGAPASSEEWRVVGKTSEGRPVVMNPKGGLSTELSITIDDPRAPGRYINIPSLFNGKPVDPRKAIEIVAKSGWKDPETGRAVESFGSIPEAETAAKSRTQSLSSDPGFAAAEKSLAPKPKGNPFLDGLNFNLERAGREPIADTPSEKIAGGVGPFSADLVRKVDADIQRTEDLARRGFHEGTASFYSTLRGAVELARQPIEKVSEATQGLSTGNAVVGLVGALKRGADYLVQKYGGTEEGAYDVVERQIQRLEQGHQVAAGQIASPTTTGERVASGIGALPQQMSEYMLAWETGGPAGMAVLEASRAQGAGEDPRTAAAKGLAEGAFFKWMEMLVPAVPKKDPGLLAERRVEIAQEESTKAKEVANLEGRVSQAQKEVEQGTMPPQALEPMVRNLHEARQELSALKGRRSLHPAEAIVESRLNMAFDAPPKEPSLLTPVQKVYAETVREFYALEKAGKQLSDPELIYATRASVGNAGHAAHFFEYGGFNAITKQTTGSKGLVPIWRSVPNAERQKFSEFLVARRAVELDARGIESGQPMEVARRIVAEGESNPAFAKAAGELDTYLDDVLRYAKDSGLISEEGYAAIKAENRAYVPYFREGKAEMGGEAGIGRGQPGQPIKAIEGSKRAVIDPFKSIARQTVRVINEADKNRLGRLLTRHADKPNAGAMVRRTGRPVEAPAAVEDPLEAIGKVAAEPLTEDAAKAMGAPRNWRTFRVYEDGKPTEYLIDPDIANALGTYNAGTSDALVDHIVIKALGIPSQVLRAGTVDMPRFFLVTNPVRDQLTLAFQTKTGAKPGMALFDGLFSYVRRDEFYKLWVRSGGSQSTLVSMDKPVYRKLIREMMEETNHPHWRQVGELAMSPLRAFQELSQAMEAASRIGEMKQGLRNVAGGSPATGRSVFSVGGRGPAAEGAARATPQQLDEIATASRDVTVDFGIKGRAQMAQMVRKLWAFSNANLQGMDRFIRLHQENPAKAAALATTLLTVPTLAMMGYQLQDPAYREAYRRLPNWRKIMFWNIDPRFMGRQEGETDPAKLRLIPIPIPFEWGLIYKAVPEALFTSYSLDDPKILTRLAETIASTSQPFIEVQDGSVSFNPPTAIQPLADLKSNRRSFFDVPIHTESELELPKEMRFDPNTSRSAVILSDWMKGMFSPKEIEVLVQGYAGSLGRSALNAGDLAAPQGPFGDIPSLRQFGDQPALDFMLGGLFPRTVEEGQSQVVTDFWDQFNDTAKVLRGWEEKVNQGDPGAEAYRQEHWDEIQAALRLGARSKLARSGRGYADEMLKIYKARRQIMRAKGMSEESKRRALVRYNRMLDQIASQAMGVPAPDRMLAR